MNWIALLGVLATAICSGGTAAAAINFFQQRPKLTAEAEDIYSKYRSRERRGDLREKAALKAEAELIEYKFDRIIDACEKLIDQVQHFPGVNVSAVRSDIRDIKYLDRIPGREPPPTVFEGES